MSENKSEHTIDSWNFRGRVLFQEDLFGIDASYGDVYTVIYSGSRTDSTEKIRRIDACCIYADGWHVVQSDDEVDYHIFNVIRKTINSEGKEDDELIIVQAMVNHNEGTMEVLDVFPYGYNTAESRIRLLKECVELLDGDTCHQVFTSRSDAITEYVAARTKHAMFKRMKEEGLYQGVINQEK